MDGAWAMPTEDPAEQLYELAQQQLAYERYDMAAEYARQALSFVSNPDLGAKLRVVLQTAEAAENMALHQERLGAEPGRRITPRKRRTHRDAEAEEPMRPMLADVEPTDAIDDTTADDVAADDLIAAAPPPAVLSRPTSGPAPTPASPPTERVSCMHCGRPLASREVSTCPGCGRDPLLADSEDSESQTVDAVEAPSRHGEGTSERDETAEPKAGSRLLQRGWIACAVALLLIIGYTGTVRARDRARQQGLDTYRRITYGSNYRDTPARRPVVARPQDTDVGDPEKRIRVSTRVGHWEGSGPWETPSFEVGESWAIAWRTDPGDANPSRYEIRVDRTDGVARRVRFQGSGPGQDTQYQQDAGEYTITIDTEQAWEVGVWRFD